MPSLIDRDTAEGATPRIHAACRTEYEEDKEVRITKVLKSDDFNNIMLISALKSARDIHRGAKHVVSRGGKDWNR
ncbi:hypothetical protein [Kibdelosporangium aridum]|uniref:hypothetical protein n=1 Tax=Kibdelosporangium aridum TaxID=2030 RepID=UPI00163B7468|nr:hypothetical protein [Kibdelosporangium aridum]